MKTLLRPLLALCLFLLPLSLAAQNASADSQKMDQIFREVIVKEQLEETAQKMQDFFSQNPFQLGAPQNERLVNLFSDAYRSDSLQSVALQAFRQNHEPKFADAVLEWTQQENTQQVLESEKEYYSLEGIRKRIVRKYELEQNPPSQDRINLIESLAENRSMAESEVESRMIMFDAMLSALNEMNNQSMDSMRMQNISGSYRAQLQSQIDQELTDQLLIMYYELDNEMLQNYGSFFETESGNWLSSTSAKSIHNAYEKAASRLDQSIQN